MQSLYVLAATAAEESPDLFGALGIDWRVLILQSVAFLVLVWLLGKFVYPTLVRAIDQRQEAIEASAKAAKEAQVAAEKAEEATEERLEKAKKEAAEIVAIAQKEATALVEEAESRATKKADHIIEQAEARLVAEVSQAREALRGEMTTLVAKATETIIKQKLDSKKDEALIESALKESR